MSTIDINNKNVTVQELNDDWVLALMQKGIIVRLEISRWSGTTKIEPHELGLRFSNVSEEFVKKYLNLGSEKLLPPQILSEMGTIERKARACLEEHSFDTIWGKFVPYNAFCSWEQKNEEIKREFFDYAREFGNKYNVIVDIVRNEYKKLGLDVWKRLYPDGGEPTESFLSEFSENIVKKIPSSYDIISKFRYEPVYFMIPMPSVIQEDLAQAREIERNKETKDRFAEIEIQAKEKLAQEFVAKKTDLIDGFIKATVSSMRKYIQELCLSVLESIEKEEIPDVNKSHQKKLLTMINKIRLLNFYDDAEIEALLFELESEVTKVKGEREKPSIVLTLKKIVQKTSEQFVPKNFNPLTHYLDL